MFIESLHLVVMAAISAVSPPFARFSLTRLEALRGDSKGRGETRERKGKKEQKIINKNVS